MRPTAIDRRDISQQPGTIHFTDRCGRSFERYEGTWTVADRDGLTMIVYRLAAKPAFDVPAFLLKRLLERDAIEMIEHLQKEIAARTARPTGRTESGRRAPSHADWR